MTGAGHEDAAASFDPLRPKLMRVAYRMLGSMADAEDMVQEAFIRWMGADRGEVREPEAFLRRTVTRLCLDQLKSARRQRETYIGPWLPDPVLEEERVKLTLMINIINGWNRIAVGFGLFADPAAIKATAKAAAA